MNRNDPLLTPEEVKGWLRLKNKDTLAVWRCTGRYDLPFIKIGQRVFYRQSDVEAFVERNRKNVGAGGAAATGNGW